MLKNYFKIAIAVLKRRKFFTFISLFGISFTLTILIVLVAFIDNVTGANYPETNRDRSLYITMNKQTQKDNQRRRVGPASFYYFDHYVSQLKTPKKMAISSFFNPTNTYVNNKKLEIDLKYTNADFWDVLEFKFPEGKPYSAQQIKSGEKVAVISEGIKDEYFGDIGNVVGKYIEADNVQYRIIGVVESVPVTMPLSYADLYVPYSVAKQDIYKKELMGNFTGILLADTKDDLEKIKAEYDNMTSKVPPDEDYDSFTSHADPFVASFLNDTPLGDAKGGTVNKLKFILSIFVLLFMTLPALNLLNINISRIMERSSEIGVRKAFGASGMTLTGQFIVENIILTFLGAILGIIFSIIILQVINSSNLIPHLHLQVNLTVLLFSILACLVFGLLSGVYPAWRMSKLPVVTALKSS